jgi:hypothetical protein
MPPLIRIAKTLCGPGATRAKTVYFQRDNRTSGSLVLQLLLVNAVLICNQSPHIYPLVTKSGTVCI